MLYRQGGQRAKLALSYFAPAFPPRRVSVSDASLRAAANADNITFAGAFGSWAAAPNTLGGKPWLGALELSDVTRFGPSGVGPAAGPVGPLTPSTLLEPLYLGAPPPLWEPFQPQPSARLHPPPPFGDTTIRIQAGQPYPPGASGVA